MSFLFREPERDPNLGNELRKLEVGTRSLADDEVLRRRILSAARLHLARLRAGSPQWWEYLTGWGRVTVPVALAASLAAALLIPGRTTSSAGDASEMSADSTLVTAAFSGPSANDWLLEQVIGQ